MPVKKATFNLDETLHRRLKLEAAAQGREMIELLEEALGSYFRCNVMTKIEEDELETYRAADSSGIGQWGKTGFDALCRRLGYSAGESGVVEQLLKHLKTEGFLLVEVNDGRTGYFPLESYPDGTGCLYRNGGILRLQITIRGRMRFQQLMARQESEQRRSPARTFQPVEIAGEPLSATVIRERR